MHVKKHLHYQYAIVCVCVCVTLRIQEFTLPSFFMQGGAEHSGDCTQRSYPLVLEAEPDQLRVPAAGLELLTFSAVLCLHGGFHASSLNRFPSAAFSNFLSLRAFAVK